MENVNENLCKERMKLQDERFARDKQRIDKVEKRLDDVENEQSDAGKALLKLTAMEEADRERLNDHDRRIETLEKKPNQVMDKAITAGISALTSAGVAGMIAKFFGG